MKKTTTRRGYWKAAGICLLLALLNGLKYPVLLKDQLEERDIVKGILSSLLLFLLMLIPAILLTRWYYRVKNRNPAE